MKKENLLVKLSHINISKIEINGTRIKLQVLLSTSENAAKVEEDIQERLKGYDVSIICIIKEVPIKKIKKIIGISSGKGGVGKSTVALNLALTLKEMGHSVGLLDADIYAPSIPVFFNINKTPVSNDGRLIEPVMVNEIQILSMGLFLQDNQAAMWRSPILSAAFAQFLEQGNWQCDYLIVDFPPGTCDLHMACSKLIPDISMLLISTPNKVVYSDVMRMYVTLRALNLKVEGVIENMAYTICENCEHKNYLTTKSGVKDVKTIAQLPTFKHFHELCETGYKNYKLGIEKKYFEEIINKII